MSNGLFKNFGPEQIKEENRLIGPGFLDSMKRALR